MSINLTPHTVPVLLSFVGDWWVLTMPPNPPATLPTYWVPTGYTASAPDITDEKVWPHLLRSHPKWEAYTAEADLVCLVRTGCLDQGYWPIWLRFPDEGAANAAALAAKGYTVPQLAPDECWHATGVMLYSRGTEGLEQVQEILSRANGLEIYCVEKFLHGAAVEAVNPRVLP
jgi:hypothetical protein